MSTLTRLILSFFICQVNGEIFFILIKRVKTNLFKYKLLKKLTKE